MRGYKRKMDDDKLLLKEIEKIGKPSLFSPVYCTIITVLGLAGNIYISANDFYVFNRRIMIALIFLILFNILIWFLYMKEKRRYKEQQKKILAILRIISEEDDSPIIDEIISISKMKGKDALKRYTQLLDSVKK